MRQRLDIADVEEKTKIRAKYLRALENEEFGLLPGSTFARTFLRTYAEQLGLDPHVLVEEYRTNFEPRDELEIPLGAPPSGGGGGERRERRYPSGPPNPWVVVGALAVALLVFLVVLGLTGGNEDKGKKSAERSAEKGKREKAKRKKPKPLPASITLKLTPTIPTYVCIDNGPGTQIIYQGILQQQRTFTAKKVRLNLGKSNVKLEENGKPFPYQDTPNPSGFEFSVKGHKQLPPEQRPCA